MAHVSIQVLNREIRRLKREIKVARSDAVRRPGCAAMLKGRIMGYRRQIREYAGLIQDLISSLPEALA